MKKFLSASLMCADLINLGDSIKKLEEAKIDYLHIDVMDGAFVPNITLGIDLINALKAVTNIPLDIHMMVNTPSHLIGRMKLGKDDIVCVHYESDVHIHRVLTQIRDLGCKAGIAINPQTPPESIEFLADSIDMALVMTVNPGFAGQKIFAGADRKTAKMRRLLDEWGHPEIPIEVDGNISPENGKMLCKNGADIFVLGTSSLFMKDKSIKQAAEDFRDTLTEE